MNDPILSLAFAMHSNKGVFALLLGSGVSRSARVPTGWEIVLDLVRKMGALREEANPEDDPAAWYRNTFGKEANYSDLLNALVHSPAERQQLLKSYFEPSEDERHQGIKLPTAAHHAIVRLVASGHIRVIVTTNFDRLIEIALEQAGITPVVISSGDSAQGAQPLAHLSCTVVKPNGDYLDPRIKNTESELASYSPPMRRLIRKILDEYGLIICGWSGDWDSGIRQLIESCPTHRFTTYWAVRSDLSEAVQRVATTRAAQIIKIRDADSFFADLEEKVRSLESIGANHPLSAKIAAATVKRYVVDPQARIRLHDLITEETARASSALTLEHFPQGTPFTKPEVHDRCRRMEAICEVLIAIAPPIAFWGEDYVYDWLTSVLEQLGDVWQSTSGSIFMEWHQVQRYPALLFLFASGLAALAAEKLDLLKILLTKPTVHHLGTTGPLVLNLPVYPPYYESDPKTGKAASRIIGYHLQRLLRPHFQDLIGPDRDYLRIFHKFEYLLALGVADLTDGSRWWPTWLSHGVLVSESPAETLQMELDKHGADTSILRAGFCQGSVERLKQIKAELDANLTKMQFSC